jgi:hypothetical protein
MIVAAAPQHPSRWCTFSIDPLDMMIQSNPPGWIRLNPVMETEQNGTMELSSSEIARARHAFQISCSNLLKNSISINFF